jgi:tRNA1(Val) A37 N6-methylase TrmN6
MISQNKINQFVAKHGVLETEKAIVKRFVESHNIDIKKSPILETYLQNLNSSHHFLENLATYETRELTNFLEILIPQNDQKINGAYFTPGYIVDFIINEIKPEAAEKNLDPSCGSGAFLIGLVDYYKRKFNKTIKQIVRENIYGSDILEYNIHRAKIILTIYALQNGEVLQEQDFNLWHQDSLQSNWQIKFDNVIGNPPYVKFQDLSDENRDYLLKNWQTIEKGTFNLYFAFYELGYKLLKETGKLAYITPNNYFTSLAAEPLRKFFHQQKCVTRIVDFSHRKVFDAQTYTAITFLSKKVSTSIFYDRIKDKQSTNDFLANANGSPNPLEELNTKKWRLLKSDEQKNIKIIENIGTPIGKLFDICVGIATLKDEVYFVDGNQVKNDYLIKKTENGTFEIEREATKAVYKISDFKNQADISLNSRRIICPYFIENGSARALSTDELKETFPKCFEYLLSEKEKLASRDKGKVRYQPFFAWGRTQGLTKFGKKILTPTFSQFPRFLIVEEEQSYFTNGYGIFLKQNKTPLFENPIMKFENIDVVQKILNSSLMHYFVKKTSVSIEGGYPCYQKNFIDKFTIPLFDEKEIDELRNLRNPSEIDYFLQKKYGLEIRED